MSDVGTKTIEDVISMAKKNNRRSDSKFIRKAYDYAKSHHSDQLRKSGEPYIVHPVQVAYILSNLGLDDGTICAALLHDTVEDTDITKQDIVQLFGEEIAELVDGVTKLGKLSYVSMEEQQVEDYRKMFLAMGKDIRVILIKLADRLHNMRTLKYTSVEKQKRVSNETLEIYAPLAHRLGMSMMKWEFEDLALRYLEPDVYYDLVERVVLKRKEREGCIEEAKVILEKAIQNIGISGEIQGRPKHFYSIFKKMSNQDKDFSDIWDLLGIRVIVDTERECYAALGCVHSIWKPIPGRFKDYIAMPKSNMYQSLHTTVMGPQGEPLEIQIRTWEMHRTAEYGIAAHWRYKDGPSNNEEFEDKITWLRQILEWQQETRDVQEFMETLKIDLFSDEVYVFTPKGDVKTLPFGSTPVDFAYAVHTNIGNRCVGSRINGKMVTLDTELQTGDIVEIMTKPYPAPSQDWLSFVKTSKARSKVKQWLKEQRKDENTEKGRTLLEKELRRLGMEVHSNLKDDKLLEIANKFSYHSVEDMLEAVGYGRISPGQIIGKLFPEKAESIEIKSNVSNKKKRNVSKGVVVKGIENVLVKFAKCCSPVPGDEIVGYITKGRGVSVHCKDCPNIRTVLDREEERKIDVEWSIVSASLYPVELEIEAKDSTGLLSSVMGVLTDMHIKIDTVNVRILKRGTAIINLTIEIADINQMNNVIKKINRMSGVFEVRRVNHL